MDRDEEIMTTPGIKGFCAKDCGRPAQVNYYKDGKMTPLCWECFRAGYNAHWRLEPLPVIVEPPTKPPAPPSGPEGPIKRPQITTLYLAAAPVERRPIEVQYDYDNQAWIQEGLYIRCGHPEAMNCDCYGKQHAGERAPSIH